MKINRRVLTTAVFVCLTVSAAMAEVRLPAVLADGMVLQQRSAVTLWGWAEPGEHIRIKGSWQWLGDEKTTTDANGNWRVCIKTPSAGGPHTLTITGQNRIVLRDILIGEVWICSGQSNMVWSLEAIKTEEDKKAIAAADYPHIRLFAVKRKVSVKPKSDCTGQWQVCTPETVRSFSAVAYYFGRLLHTELNIPIGLICTAWGGTPAEAWTRAEALRTHGDFDNALDNLLAYDPNADAVPNSSTPSVLYNGMIHPLVPFRIAGAVWYQGESNATRAIQYRTLFPAMIADWRTQWGQGDFPFYYVQIAPYKYKDSNLAESALLRESQLLTLKTVPNVGMAVTMDIGEELNIHPGQKSHVGRRLALWALANTYQKKNLVYSGPLYRQMHIERDTLRLFFDYEGSGLVTRGQTLTDFEIAGPDRLFIPAQAVIDGNTVVVSSEQVATPAAVRYAFKNWAKPNLFNAEGLPASSFRTDDWPME